MSPADRPWRRLPRAGALGLAVQILLLAVLAAAALARQRALASERALPPLRPRPLAVTPLYDDPAVASDEQLHRVLPRLGLRRMGARTAVGSVEHALRAWGPEAVFANPGFMSGQDMRRLLTSNWRFLGTYGPRQPPLLLDAAAEVPAGVRVRALEGAVSSPHVDHLLASLAEIGTPLDQPLVTPRQRTTLRAMLEQSLRDFSLNQTEYEWSALAYALYLPPARRWRTSEGQEMTFDRLAARIEREALPRGVCAGNHRLFTLVVLLRIDDQMAAQGAPRILSPGARRRATDFLRAATAALVRHQHADGFWNGDWPSATPAASRPSGKDGDELADRIIVTGHALEWWSLAPREVLPPRPVRVAAGQWLVRTIDAMSDDEIQVNISYLSHAGRALAQWRGRSPAAELGRRHGHL